MIEKHEELAKVGFGFVSGAAVVSLIGLLFYHQTGIRRLMGTLALLLDLGTSGILAVTAHLGGQVRHTEIRSGFGNPTENETNNNLPEGESENND